MAGIRRTAVAAAAFLVLGAAYATADSPPTRQHALAAGTAVVFVTDAPLNEGRRDGDVVSVHLRDPLVLDGTVLAPAGTRAVILVGNDVGTDGRRIPLYALERFSIPAGLLPVRAVAPIRPPLASGTEIPAKTLAVVERLGEHVSIDVPFPYRLSADPPASAYTPTPARTPPPKFKPTPRPTQPPAPSPAPDATATAAAQR